MRLFFEFETEDSDLHPINLARMLLDIQHLVIVLRALSKDQLQPDDIVFDPYKQKYKWMIEATGDDIGDAELTINRITKESPFSILLKVKELPERATKAFVQAYRYITNLLLIDLEREKRSVEILLMREQVLGKRIETVSAALDLVKKFPDEQLRREFIENLKSSVLPFVTEHPPIKSVTLITDKNEEVAHDVDEQLIDNSSNDSKPN